MCLGLTAVEFKVELNDRYGLDIMNNPSHCVDCYTEFSTTYGLGCEVCGFILSRHHVVVTP